MKHLRHEVEDIVVAPAELGRVLTSKLEIDTSIPEVADPELGISDVRRVNRALDQWQQAISDDFKAIQKKYDVLAAIGGSDWRLNSSLLEERVAPTDKKVDEPDLPTICYDPNDPRSLLGAIGSLAGPLARVTTRKMTEFSAPKPVAEDTVRSPKPVHDGEVEPILTPERIRRGIIVGGAGIVTTAVLLNGISNSGNLNPIKNKTEQQAKAEIKPQLVVTQKEVALEYVPKKDVSLKVVAVDLQTPSKLLAKTNPGLRPDAVIPAGTKVGGMVRVSSIKIEKPVSVEEVSKQYGLSEDAVLSVNQVDKDGFIHKEVNIAGRNIIPIDQDKPVDIDAVAQHIGLGEASTRTLAYINQETPKDRLVVPLYGFTAEAEEKLADPVSIAAVAEGVIAPGETLAPPIGEAAQLPSTTIAVPSTEYHPEDATTTSLPTSTTSTPKNTTPKQKSTTTTTTAVDAQNPKTEKPVPKSETTTTTSVSTTVPAEVAPAQPEAPAEKYFRNALPEEKFAAEREAVKQALDNALYTNDLGALNHLIAYSPIFKAYNLPADEQALGIRSLPPSELLGIPGLKYEFSTDTPDRERWANTYVIALTLHAAYTYQNEIALNPDWSAKYADSCLRVGDLSAHNGHKSHFGAQVDLTTALHCNFTDGHQQADGPIFWINHISGEIHRNNVNPNYNLELEKRILGRLLGARIDKKPLLKSILYNATNLGLSGVNVHPNHSNHIHINGYGAGNQRLKLIAEGGVRPELNPDQIRALWYLAYAGGDGVVGLSKDMKVEVTLDQFAALQKALEEAKTKSVSSNSVPDSEPTTSPPASANTDTDNQTPPVANPAVDIASVLPLNAGIPPEIIGLIKPSKHFTAIELAAQIYNESKFETDPVSPVGAMGLCQFMPGTWKALGRDDPHDPDDVASPFNPVEATDAMRRLMDGHYEWAVMGLLSGKLNGDPKELALAAYNAGSGRVSESHGVPAIRETRNYIKRIREKRDQFALQYLVEFDQYQKNQQASQAGEQG